MADHPDTQPVEGNLLAAETSPYLLQHATNPVHWRGWGAAALAEARARQKPILLSVGYAACHWCHVMAHESFEDAETAALMNALYVNIKVDREERPDIDQLYMSALHALGEQGGWPLTMFLTPDGAPFWGGTYFPPSPRWGRPSFRQVLQGVANSWHGENAGIAQNVAALGQALEAMSATHPGDLPTPATLDQLARRILRNLDPNHGGFKGAPKFPNPPSFRFLWHHACAAAAGSADATMANGLSEARAAARDAVHLLLERMSQGGLYDHLGGGFSRYSTDAEWLAPHFEKMLYDNAQILELLALAHAGRPCPLYAARAAETVEWLTRDMTAATVLGRAGFAASEDADSEGEEGRFYVWTEAEIDAVLTPSLTQAQIAVFKAAYDVTDSGNWEGHCILRRVLPSLGATGGVPDEAIFDQARRLLFAVRGRRIRPGRDDKVLADWNGLAVAALCRAASVFRRPDWLLHAERAFDFVMTEMATSPGSPDAASHPASSRIRLAHAWRLGRTTAAGLLDDHAAMARAALALFEATGAPARLEQAIALARAAEAWFGDADGDAKGGLAAQGLPTSFFISASDAADVPFGPAGRPRSVADNAVPSGNGLMAELYARLYHLTGDADWRSRAEAVIRAFAGLGDGLSGAPTLLAALDLLERCTVVVVAGDPSLPTTQALLAAALTAADPAVCVLRAPDGPDAFDAKALPVLHPAYGKTAAPYEAAAFICRNGACGLPITDPAACAEALRPAAMA